jgi:ADP-ribosyl-[dinitrogen reductase] hydrolase
MAYETKYESQYQGTLLMGALGDTLGMPVEGWDRDQIRRHVGFIKEPIDPVIIRDVQGNIVHKDETGRIPYVSPYLNRYQITDDTWLTIGTARSIVEAKGLNLNNLAKHSISIYQEQMQRMRDITPSGTPIAAFLHPESEIPQPFGGSTIAAFENLQNGMSPTESGVLSRNPGNAPTIKMAPVGMYMHATGKYEEGLQFAEQVGRMTHLDPRSIVSGIMQAHGIYALLHGASRDEFLNSTLEVCKQWEKSKDQGKKVTVEERFQWVVDNKDVDEETAYQTIGIGWPVTKNYPFTLFMFQKYWDNAQIGLLKTVNFGGDCDSTGAIYGNLAGAKNGMFLPNNWTNQVERSDELKNLAKDILAIPN